MTGSTWHSPLTETMVEGETRIYSLPSGKTKSHDDSESQWLCEGRNLNKLSFNA
jgi:hypothetical protein